MEQDENLLRRLLAAACKAQPEHPGIVFETIPEVTSEIELPLEGPVNGWSRRLQLGKTGEVTVVARSAGGRLRQAVVTHSLMVAGTPRPQTFIAAGPNCRIRAARSLRYDSDENPLQIDLLDSDLRATGKYELLNPPIPKGVDPGGIAVGMLDAGVNYRLPEIASRLARDEEDNALGFDFWDMDPRPFDANPARSPFFPQRHGTRTASLLLLESPVARLVPYRYPRPDMSRMTSLVQHASKHGVRIVNMSLGSNRYEEWQDFEAAARAAPDILFIASAGNDGRDIDERPVYPAALSLPNLITVTSGDDSGNLAERSNRGAKSVHLMVPGERIVVTGFNGQPRMVSGSSYAVVRVTALAACLLAERPEMGAPELKQAIFSRATSSANSRRHVAIGFLPDPVAMKRGPCPAQRTRMELTETYTYRLPPPVIETAGLTHVFRPAAAVMAHSGWERATVQEAFNTAAGILAQCGIRTPGITMHFIDGPERFRYYLQDQAVELIRWNDFGKPVVYFLSDTLERVRYDAVSFGRVNSRRRPELADTVWLTRQLPHPGVGLAHELAHVLMNSGEHAADPANLMHERTSDNNQRLTPDQCERMVSNGESNGLLERIK